MSKDEAEVVLYPTTAFSVYAMDYATKKLFRMGVRLTNTEKDRVLFHDEEDNSVWLLQ